jgi:hypothetical protein
MEKEKCLTYSEEDFPLNVKIYEDLGNDETLITNCTFEKKSTHYPKIKNETGK